MDLDKVAVLIGIAIPVVVFSLAFLGCCIYRRCRSGTDQNSGYHIVNHDLDDEEIEFKRILEKNKKDKSNSTQIEMSSTAIPTYDDDDDEVSFSESDLNRLEMLEKYRSNLVAGAKSTVIGNENEREDLRV